MIFWCLSYFFFIYLYINVFICILRWKSIYIYLYCVNILLKVMLNGLLCVCIQEERVIKGFVSLGQSNDVGDLLRWKIDLKWKSFQGIINQKRIWVISTSPVGILCLNFIFYGYFYKYLINIHIKLHLLTKF